MVRLGGKVNDTRTIVGGEVQSKHPGKEMFVIALDFSAQYPAQIEANNISSSTRVDERIIENPTLYGLKLVEQKVIRDSYNTRNVYWFEHIDKTISDKRYRVEQFFCAFKLDVDSIKKSLALLLDSEDEDSREDAVNNVLSLYPECRWSDKKRAFILPTGQVMNLTNIPQTITKKVYFVQSKKAVNGWTEEHLSLNEIMLTDLRFTRNAVKKQKSEAETAGDHFNAIRYNAKQLAVKIVCNSTYGASGSRFYAYYDTAIGASITWASREMIHNLTYVLESDHIYVDKEFLEENREQFDVLLKYGLVETVSPNKHNAEDKPENIIALSLRRLFDEYWQMVDYSKVIRVNIKPATIIYQDTDSNYYIIRYVQELFKDRHSPEDINECMQLMKKHNEFFQEFMSFSVFRPPIGLGFEAAKIVARYFNVKKRYYGIEWDPNMKSQLCSEAYENGVLKEKYNEYWKPGETTLPREDGGYIDVNAEELLDKGLDFVAYMHNQNLSVTGMPLTRRDSYRFANFLNLEVYKQDLMVCKYIGNNQWENALKDSLEEVIHNVINSFKMQVNYIEKLVKDAFDNIDREYNLPTPFFRLKDYSQQAQYKPDKHNDVMDAIRARYKEKGRKDIEVFERVNFVCIDTPKAKELAEAGKADIGKVSELAFTIDELLDEYREKVGPSEYSKLKASSFIDYDTFIELFIISNLCYRHYMKALCLTLSQFAVEYLKKDEILMARDIMDKDERKKRIAKATDEAGKELLKEYFTFGKNTFKDLDDIRKNWTKQYKIPTRKTIKMNPRVIEEIHSIFPKYGHVTDPNAFKVSLNRLYENCMIRMQYIMDIIKAHRTNRFNSFSPEDDYQRELLEVLSQKNGMNLLVKDYERLCQRANQVNWILTQLN